MKVIVAITVSAMLLISNAVVAKHSSSGRNPPRKLSERQLLVLEKLVPLIPKENDPIEIVALAMVESGLTPTAVGYGNYGILQINCTVHQESIKKIFGFENCRKDMLDINKNVPVSLNILHRMRTKYRQCRGSRVYACYNGGPGWRVVMRRCLEACEGDTCKKCNRPERYSNSVKKHMRFLKRKYRNYIYSLFNGGKSSSRESQVRLNEERGN